jgi:fumarate hydratase subunit alpha
MPSSDPSGAPAAVRAGQAAVEAVEEAAKQTYIRALKLLPPDVKAALRRAAAVETTDPAQEVMSIIEQNLDVAEGNEMLVCQDTGTVVYWLEVGEDCAFNLGAVSRAIRKGTERATLEHPLRPNAVHPVTRKNTMTNTGRHLPAIHYDFLEGDEEHERRGVPRNGLKLHCLPKGSGSENMSFLKMFVPADGVKAVKRYVLECILDAGPKPCPPTLVGVGLGGTSDLCAALAKRAVLRPIGTHNDDPVIAAIEDELYAAANELGIGPMGLGGRTTVLGVNIEHAHTHITQNPVAVNLQCWAARRSSAVIAPDTDVEYGF